MYISITKQHLDTTFSKSCGDFVGYLEKENRDKAPEHQEHFFDQHNDQMSPEHVVKEIDSNTAKLRKSEPKFYSLTINPSQRELKHIGNDPDKLRQYVRETMKAYASSFNRDTPVSVDSIKYYAKIEYERIYKGFDKEIKENQPYRAKIVKLEHDLVKIRRGELAGNSQDIQKAIEKLRAEAPHRMDGKMIEQGMKKQGFQTHVHIIVSRKDVTNKLSLSPGSSYKASEVMLNGSSVKRGFDRDGFFEKAEKTFDTLFKYDRNFVEQYSAHKMYQKDTYKFFAQVMALPTNEKSAAFKIMGKSGMQIPNLNIPTNQVQMALKAFKQLKRTIDVAKDAGSIGI
ncbi:MobB family relaxase [Aestuariibaculum sediminum]|uniref:Mobilization protein n=1 Tax=Aestuariibaculum sediminum TaxID=2770637 RepID=A0A8J6QAE1_9FLAO|nr:MobB family relaxase [Aestuariibaculum sediminum]MBD0833352.1 mobilization protein [Aestuariibaculum sediminum]